MIISDEFATSTLTKSNFLGKKRSNVQEGIIGKGREKYMGKFVC